jgi:putative ATP-dependent endonuclease of OLD family
VIKKKNLTVSYPQGFQPSAETTTLAADNLYISKITITNFKCFKDKFELPLTDGLNIIVGNNEAGKSTILEALHLALSGLFGGKYLKSELSEYLFNKDSINAFKANPIKPPEILIELFFEGANLAIYEGDGNSERKKSCGISLKIALDEKDRELYDNYIKSSGEEVSLPIEYYEATWQTFAREVISTKHLPFKSAFIDSSSSRYQNGSDIYISHIIRTHLESSQRDSLTQTHRKLQDTFMKQPAVIQVNSIIKEISKKTAKDKEVRLNVDLSAKNSWENSMLTYVENIPFHHIGKGHQAIVKTKLALEHKKAQEANVILLEEPENHLSHTNLSQLIKDIDDKCKQSSKQILISTHSSFVANKLGLDKLILLDGMKHTRLRDLTTDTINFFRKVTGYDTLRLILCDAAILCEGDSDELIIQKKYLKKHGCLPIENNIEVISVGLSFDRYIEIGKKLGRKLAIVTDNDNRVEALKSKYLEYNDNPDSTIKAFFDADHTFPTLEPQLIKYNGWELVNQITDERYKINVGENKKGDYKHKSEEELLKFMSENKTECALKFFDTMEEFTFPKYIEEAIEHVEAK